MLNMKEGTIDLPRLLELSGNISSKLKERKM
jgi:hypothetical protein